MLRSQISIIRHVALLWVLAAVWLAGCATPPPPAAPATGAAKPVSLLQKPTSVVAQEDELSPVGDVVRVCTYNIQDFTDGVGDGYERTKAVTQRHIDNAARVVNELNPDILVLEEIENPVVLERLNELMMPPYPLVYISNFNEEKRGTKRNIALLSRHPLLRVSEIDFARAENQTVHLSRGALVFAVNLGQQHVLLGYGVHLKSNFGKDDGKDESNIAKRKAGLQLVRDHADEVIAANPGIQWEVLVAGDMNVDPELPAFSKDTSLEPTADWVDLWLGRPIEERITIPMRHGDPELAYPGACFDRVIVSPALIERPWRVDRIEVLQRGVDTENVFTRAGQNEIHASDHYPVYVDIVR